MTLGTLEQPLSSLVDDELRMAINGLYKKWREQNPIGDIIDWMVGLPGEVHWVIRTEFATQAEARRSSQKKKR